MGMYAWNKPVLDWIELDTGLDMCVYISIYLSLYLVASVLECPVSSGCIFRVLSALFVKKKGNMWQTMRVPSLKRALREGLGGLHLPF